jgi:uncharacterized protein (TIGR02145 family)
VGNARTNSSFSATVKLLTAIKDVGGACVYGSNYPPVGEYKNNATEISFTGTPMYNIVLEKIADGSTYTISTAGLYSIHAGEVIQSFTDRTGAPGIMKCTTPGSTVDFTAFSPCSNAVTGDYWYLTDTREAAYGNTQTYKVKKMVDGHIWMVQDMKFGDKCNKATLDMSSGKDLTGNVTSLTGMTYYGDCTAATTTNTPPKRGYLYNWAAVINKSGAFSGSSSDVGCSGTGSGIVSPNPGTCQGICPIGWHVPTGDQSGEFQALHDAFGTCSLSNDDCWNSTSLWEGVRGGYARAAETLWTDGTRGHYLSSSNNGATCIHLVFDATWTDPSLGNAGKAFAYALRCLKNY